MADFLENDLDIGALIEQQLEQALEQELNNGANTIVILYYTRVF